MFIGSLLADSIFSFYVIRDFLRRQCFPSCVVHAGCSCVGDNTKRSLLSVQAAFLTMCVS